MPLRDAKTTTKMLREGATSTFYAEMHSLLVQKCVWKCDCQWLLLSFFLSITFQRQQSRNAKKDIVISWSVFIIVCSVTCETWVIRQQKTMQDIARDQRDFVSGESTTKKSDEQRQSSQLSLFSSNTFSCKTTFQHNLSL